MRASSRPSVPRPGDIVICRGNPSASEFLLSIVGQVSQLIFYTFDDAARDAMTLAARKGVTAWYTANGETYERINSHGRYRHAASTAA